MSSLSDQFSLKFETTPEPSVIWLTGLSGAGKSTIAQALAGYFKQRRIQCYVLDGDVVRQGLCRDLGFSKEDRTENIRRIGEVSKLFVQAGVVVITAFISPYREDRDKVRRLLPAGRFVEIFVDCPLAECEHRDPKGYYRQARKGLMKTFTGISDPYEYPLRPEIHLRTDNATVEECVEKILEYLSSRIPASNPAS